MPGMDEDTRRLGRTLKKARLVAGLTQEEAAARLELSVSMLSNYERGAVARLPKRAKLRLFAEVYEAPELLSQVFRDEEGVTAWQEAELRRLVEVMLTELRRIARGPG